MWASIFIKQFFVKLLEMFSIVDFIISTLYMYIVFTYIYIYVKHLSYLFPKN